MLQIFDHETGAGNGNQESRLGAISQRGDDDARLPVIIGHGTNDLPLTQIAIELGGQAIVMPRPDGSYALPIAEAPAASRARKAADEGIAEVLPFAVALEGG